MRWRELKQIIAGGESLTCEFKLHFSSHEKIARELIAFANTSGGVLILGVEDNGSIVGVASEKSEAELINQVVNDYCVPPVSIDIQYIKLDGKELVVVIVPESKNKPHRIQDYKEKLEIQNAQVYVRVNDKSIQASKETIRLLKTEYTDDPLKLYSLGHIEKAVFIYLEQKEKISVAELCGLCNISGRRASRTLVNMVRAGIMLKHTKENGDEYFTARLEIND
ncbi:MAG: ATP-binding protein [Ignavibacteria bacterium]|nr:ATP-binding protein [Ignavibacteria bacterium]